MPEIRLNIDGREVVGFDGQTILDIARENGIDIPTLCHDDRVKMYGSCGICAVEAAGMPRLLRACSTLAADGMILSTNTERVRKSRKTALELLLSDHVGDCRPPCVLACPAQTDCQGYVGLIANGAYHEALKLVKDKIPLPGSIGRVCPHPCEEACRRKLVEEPINILALKQFVADKNAADGDIYTAETGKDTGKSVAIIGGGPGGLAAAYFLRLHGHAVTVFDAMPEMGGMLRYGIPEYRLPKKYLADEIAAIEKMGVVFKNGVRIGRDTNLKHLRDKFDAVIVAVGAWTSMALRCPGEELNGVIGGIDFLREVSLGKFVFTGRKIAVVGGGNTAMDACRTAVRLGAEKVYNIYRRTRAEMPAEEIEIDEAEEEGVIFRNLTNPIEVIGENGKVKALHLQIMELGEPDASGRRAPVPVEGQEDTVEVDTVIVAIGQGLDAAGLDGLALNRRGNIAADEISFTTSLPGVFAIGDAVNKGADIAISAIGHAQKAAAMVDKYLSGEELSFTEPFLSKTDPAAADFADRERQPRAKMPHRSAKARRGDFLEINLGLSEEEARREASRCLECGCNDFFECKLVDYANQYAVMPQKYTGKVHVRKQPDDHPFIRRNPDKCILCGLCVRICDEVVGATALGLVGRGFDTVVKPALDANLTETDCISCGQCISACPTGALTEMLPIEKQVPVRTQETSTTCAFCSVGCQTKLAHTGNLLVRSLPHAEKPKEALLCAKGRFGFGELKKQERLLTPLLRENHKLLSTGYEQAIVYMSKKMQSIQSQYGRESIAVAVSDRMTNEEAALIKEYANRALHTNNVFSFGKCRSGIADVLGRDGSTTDFAQLKNTDCILLVECDIRKPHLIAGLAVKKAAENGAKLLVMNSFDSAADELATHRFAPGIDLEALKQLAKAVLDRTPRRDLAGYAELADYLAAVVPCEAAQHVAAVYCQAKNAMIVFEQNRLSADAARLLADIAVLAGQISRPRAGIIQLKPNANSQGLCDLGVKSFDVICPALESGAMKGLFVFGEDVPDIDLSGLEFLAVQELSLTATAKKADIVFPARSFAEVDGTFTNTVGAVQTVRRAVNSPVAVDNRELVRMLARQAGEPCLEPTVASSQNTETRLAVPAGDRYAREPVRNTNALYASFLTFAEANHL